MADLTKLLTAAQRRDFQLLLPISEVRTAGAGRHLVGTGCATVRSTEAGGLALDLVLTTRPDGDHEWQRMGRLGRILDGDRLLILTGTDAKGTPWNTSSFHPSSVPWFPTMAWQTQAAIEFLETSSERQHDSGGYRAIVFGNSADVPMSAYTRVETKEAGQTVLTNHTLDRHAGSIGTSGYRAQSLDHGQVLVRVEDSTWSIDDTATAVRGALSMLLGHDAEMLGAQWSEGGQDRVRLYSRRERGRGAGLPSPIPYVSTSPGEFWSFFETIVMFSRSHPQRALNVFHALFDLRAAGRTSLRNACLVAGVAVESLIGDDLFASFDVDRAVDDKTLDSVGKHMQTWSGDHALVERIGKVLSQLRNVPKHKRLVPWARSASVPARYVKSWGKLRHKAAHGERIDFEQVTMDRYFDLVYLIYHLVAAIVEYKRPITYERPPVG